MANDCPSYIQGCAVRVARLDATGATPAGAMNGYIAAGLVKVNLKNVIQAGQEIIVPNACGGVDVDYKVPDFIRRLDITIEFTRNDPELTEILTGAPLVTVAGATNGWAYPDASGPNAYPGVSLEVYVKRVRKSQLLTPPYARWVLPFNLLLPSDRDIDEGASPNVFVGQSFENVAWGNGPFNDWPTGAPSGRLLATNWESVLPTTACGYTAVPTQV